MRENDLVQDFRQNALAGNARTFGLDLDAVALERLSVSPRKIRVELDIAVGREILVGLEALERVDLASAATLMIGLDAADVGGLVVLCIFSHGKISFSKCFVVVVWVVRALGSAVLACPLPMAILYAESAPLSIRRFTKSAPLSLCNVHHFFTSTVGKYTIIKRKITQRAVNHRDAEQHESPPTDRNRRRALLIL